MNLVVRNLNSPTSPLKLQKKIFLLRFSKNQHSIVNNKTKMHFSAFILTFPDEHHAKNMLCNICFTEKAILNIQLNIQRHQDLRNRNLSW